MSTRSTSYEEAHSVQRSPRVKARPLISLPLLGLLACGSGGDAGPDAVQLECPTTGRYMALGTGASWTYEVDDGGGIETKTQSVGALEDVGGSKAGTMAFRL